MGLTELGKSMLDMMLMETYGDQRTIGRGKIYDYRATCPRPEAGAPPGSGPISSRRRWSICSRGLETLHDQKLPPGQEISRLRRRAISSERACSRPWLWWLRPKAMNAPGSLTSWRFPGLAQGRMLF